MITDMLQDVINRGTARSARGSLKGVAIAGKTGTSRDGWFVGYTPNLVCAVWIGYDDNKQLGLTGAEAALPAWVDFMKETVELRPSLGGSSFAKPAGIVTVRIDPESGFLAGPNCPSAQTVRVASQFAPIADCYIHAPEYEYTNYSETDSPDTTEESAEPVAGNSAATADDENEVQTVPEAEPELTGAEEQQHRSTEKVSPHDKDLINPQPLMQTVRKEAVAKPSRAKPLVATPQ